MRAVAPPGRWIWGLSGLVTAVAIAVPGARLIASAGEAPPPPDTVTRTVTVSQPVTRVDVQSCGDPVQVTADARRRVRITESIEYGPQGNGPPAVPLSVSGGRLALIDPACTPSGDGRAGFTLTVPPGAGVTVSSEGGPVEVSGIAGADLDSGGGPVRATAIGGPLTVSTGGGPLLLGGLTGPLRADTAGGSLTAQGVDAATAVVTTGGGAARIAFSAPPDSVTISTDGGPALLAVPGGPYALTADNGGGPELVAIATDPRAGRSITVSSGGGPLRIVPLASPKSAPPGPVPAPPPQPAQPRKAGGSFVGSGGQSSTN